MDESAITIKSIITEEDFCKFKMRALWRLQLIFCWLLLIIWYLFNFVYNDFETTGSLSLVLTLSAITFIILMIIFVMPLAMKKVFQKEYRKDTVLHHEQTFVIKPDEFEAYSPNGSSRFLWRELKAYEETKEAFLVHTHQNVCFYISKRNIESNEGQLIFIRQNLSNLPEIKRSKLSNRRKEVLHVLLWSVGWMAALILILLILLSLPE